MNQTYGTPSTRIWRLLGLSAVLLLVTTVSAIALISAGIFDPQPIGVEQARQSLKTQHFPAETSEITWLEQPTLAGEYTVRLTAAYEHGEQDIGYGLVVGESQQFLAISVSPLGYAAVWRKTTEGGVEYLVPWRPWPHVAKQGALNELQVDVESEQVTVRINRELLWQGSATVTGGQVGMYGESFGSGTTVAFQELIWFAPDSR